MADQIRIAASALARAPPAPKGPRAPESELGSIFETEYADAVAAAAEGRTVSPRDQILRAALRAGREVDLTAYLADLQHEVETLPFRRAPGALELLRGLRADGYRLAVISNTVGEPGAFVRPTLTRMGFDDWVEGYIFSDEFPWAKPAPEIFRTALDRIGSVAGAAVHVGDGWSDMEGARRAGYRSGILFTGLQEYGERYRALFASSARHVDPSTPRVERLEEIAPLVRELLPLGRS